MEAILVE